MHDFAPYLPLLGSLLGLLSLAAAFRAGRRWRLVDNLPISKTTGVFIGLVELEGSAEPEHPLVSYLAGAPCVYYRWNVEEHWSRTVVESYTDSNGKPQMRTRYESGWTSVGSGSEITRFYLRDDCGVTLVRPEGAKLEPSELFDQTCGRGDPLYYAKGPAQAVGDSDHRRRFTEQGIAEHARLYVMGQAREREDVVAPEIAADGNAPMFLISTRSQEQVSAGMKWGERGWALLGVIPTVGSFVLRDSILGIEPRSQLQVYALAALGYLVIAGLLWVWMVFNDIATHYNTRLEILPEKFVAALGGMMPQTLMAANAFERAAVKIEQAPPGEQSGLLKCKT